jgi:hypothetical protein
MLSEYVKCTDELIGRMDGSIRLAAVPVHVLEAGRWVTIERDLPPPTAMLWLDKSARPVSWLTRAFWPLLAGDARSMGRRPPRPRDYYLNIDKEDWLHRMGVAPADIQDAPAGAIDLTRIDAEHIDRIRAIFSTIRVDEDGLGQAWDQATLLDGQHVMIVDEVRSSGRTLQIALQLLSHAIPDATFSGQHWASPPPVPLNRGAQVGGRLQFAVEWVPVWYEQSRESGRGVGPRDAGYPERAAAIGQRVSRYAKLGRYVLSTPPHDPTSLRRVVDERACDLRDDISRLVGDVADRRVLYRPSPAREAGDFEQRIVRIAGIGFDEWRRERDRLAPRSPTRPSGRPGSTV